MDTEQIPIIELIRMSLKGVGANGLCNSDIECGCKIDDLCPCGNPDLTDCIAGVSITELAKKYNVDFWIAPLPKYKHRLKTAPIVQSDDDNLPNLLHTRQ